MGDVTLTEKQAYIAEMGIRDALAQPGRVVDENGQREEWAATADMLKRQRLE